jgi:hypothetical protein
MPACRSVRENEPANQSQRRDHAQSKGNDVRCHDRHFRGAAGLPGIEMVTWSPVRGSRIVRVILTSPSSSIIAPTGWLLCEPPHIRASSGRVPCVQAAQWDYACSGRRSLVFHDTDTAVRWAGSDGGRLGCEIKHEIRLKWGCGCNSLVLRKDSASSTVS